MTYVDCARCGHLDLAHASHGELAECGRCDCRRYLTDSDCKTCDGDGVIPVEAEQADGRVLDDEKPCRDCAGTGTNNQR